MEISDEASKKHLTEAEKQQVARIYFTHFDIKTNKIPYGAMNRIINCLPGRTIKKRTVQKIIQEINKADLRLVIIPVNRLRK